MKKVILGLIAMIAISCKKEDKPLEPTGPMMNNFKVQYEQTMDEYPINPLDWHLTAGYMYYDGQDSVYGVSHHWDGNGGSFDFYVSDTNYTEVFIMISGPMDPYKFRVWRNDTLIIDFSETNISAYYWQVD